MSRRRVAQAAAALAALPLAAAAQVITQSGHALDANLRLGSGGYNTPTGRAARPLNAPTYTVRPMTTDYYNAFMRQRHYRPSRSTSRPPAGVGSMHPSYDPGYAPRVAPPPRRTPVIPPDPMPEADAQMQTISYGIGYLIGEEVARGLRRDGLELNLEQVAAGFGDGLTGAEPAADRELIEQTLIRMHDELERRIAERLEAGDAGFRSAGEANRSAGRVFRERFAAREGVVALPGGILYEVLEAGDAAGVPPAPDDAVVVSYRVLNLEGAVILEGERQQVDVADAVEGVRTLLAAMRPGDRWLAVIPPELAHGAAGNPPAIGPHATLYGEIELIEVVRRRP